MVPAILCSIGWFLLWTGGLGILCAILYFDIFNRWLITRQDLTGKHIVIPGGSSGIGKEIGYLAAKRGAHVTIISRDLKKLTETAKELKKRCVNSTQKIIFFQADVSKYDQIDPTIRKCEEQIAPIDILVNCAGYSYPTILEDIPMEHIRGMMDVNYFGSLNATRAVLPYMKARQSGKITFVSSISGLVGVYGLTAYSGTKFAVRGFAEALQMEVKPFGISVTVAFPPDADTPSLTWENQFKPDETFKIAETAGTYQPDVIAESILKDTLAEDFFSTIGFEGVMSSMNGVGMAPMSSVIGLVGQALLLGIIRVVSLGYLFYFNRIVAKCHQEKQKNKKSK